MSLLKKSALPICSLLFVFGLSACNNEKEKSTTEAVQAQYNQFKKEMSSNMDALSKKIDQIEEKMNKQGKQAEKGLDKKIANLKDLRSEMSEKLEKFSDSANDKYVDLKTDIESTYEELEAEVEKLTN